MDIQHTLYTIQSLITILKKFNEPCERLKVINVLDKIKEMNRLVNYFKLLLMLIELGILEKLNQKVFRRQDERL